MNIFKHMLPFRLNFFRTISSEGFHGETIFKG